MAELNVKFFSRQLNRNVTFKMFIPNNREVNVEKCKTLFLLHGYTGEAENWVPEYLSQKYNFAVVAPNGENGFWLDGLSTGHKYCSFVGKELVEYIRLTFNLALTAQETYIMGLSMGGFGALHTAFAYPENFGKTAAMSSALIVHQVAAMKPGKGTDLANYEYYRECFGEPSEVLNSDNNPEILIKRLKDSGSAIPEIFMCCGTEDFLLSENRAFHSYLEKIGISHTYLESSGAHDMTFWNEYTVRFIEMMFAQN